MTSGSWRQILEDQLWCGSYSFSSGGLSRSSLIKLSSKAYLVYSPSSEALALEAKRIIPEDADIFLLASNSYHNIGLSIWPKIFPKAQVVAADVCGTRLKKKLGIDSKPLSYVLDKLPSHIKILELPNNRVGESWISIDHPAEGTYWIVCDGFFNIESIPKKGMMKWFLTLNRMGPGLSISRMFTYYAVKNRSHYKSWLKDLIEKHRPTHLIPCHGKIIDDKQLAARLEQVIATSC